MRLGAFICLAAVPVVAQNWGTRPARVISKSEPEYSEEARRAGVSSSVVLSFEVSEDGIPEDIQIVQGAGFGLDEQAIETVSQWRFDPANREGRPFREKTRVELQFRISSKKRNGQMARLIFSLPADVSRPELVEGAMPVNVVGTGNALVRVRMTVNPQGMPENVQLFEASNQLWADAVLREMQNWRFRAPERDGHPEEVSGVFELRVHQGAPENRPTLRRATVNISPPGIQDIYLPAPKLIAPPDHAMVNGYPRRITCKWEPAPGAYGYLLEWDYMYHEVWNAEFQGVPGTAFQVSGTEFTFDFVGAQPGRWRVWPVDGSGHRGNPSEWRTFRCLR